LGRLLVPRKNEVGGVRFGVHQAQPLVEARVQFHLDTWELDNVVRGAGDVDLGEAEKAAQKIAAFEDGAVINGFAEGYITGIAQAAAHKLPLDLDPPGYMESVSNAVLTLRDAGVEGPYSLLVGPKAFRALASRSPGYPLERQVRQLIEGKIVYSRVTDGAMLISCRGGDLEMTLGQDLSIGYETHDTKSVRLFLAESFTFRVLDPSVIVLLKAGGGRKRR
jgi:uncharacterized linocin/CFP29 family protein